MENQKRTLIRHFRPTPPISAHFPLSTLFPPNSSYFPSFHPIPLFSFFFLFFPFFPFSPSRRSGYVLTSLRAYAYAAVLCAHYVARIRLRRGAMCSLRCAHTHRQLRYFANAQYATLPSRRSGYVLTSLRAYAYAAVLCAHCVARIRTASSAISLTLNTLRSFFQRAPSYL